MISPRDLFQRFEALAGTRRILVRDLAAAKTRSGAALLDQVLLETRQLRKEGIAPGDQRASS